jgi:Ser/Thr protein kinase RdoA (MazF antagonist)
MRWLLYGREYERQDIGGMKTIDNLSHGGQIRRLRELAEAVLTQYELGNARISLLSRRENSMFQVVASPAMRRTLPEFEGGDEEEYYEEGSEEEELEGELVEEPQERKPVLALSQAVEPIERPIRSRYVLRLYTETRTSSAMIMSELQWLTALRRDTGLGVPEPVSARTGLLLTELEMEGMSEVIRGVVFRWVDGRFVDAGLTPLHLERVGVLMARMHHHAKTFTPPAGFIRPRWDWRWVFGENSVLNPQYVASMGGKSLSVRQQRILEATAQKVEDEMQSLPPDAENYGLIHYDLQQTNYLFYKDEARAIDFEDCCFGYYLFDIAITLASLIGRQGEQAMREAFFRGYVSMRALPPHYEELLQTFTAMRLIKRANYLLRLTEGQSPEKATDWLIYTVDWLDTYLKSHSRGS